MSVSVAMATFNGQAHLPEQLQSIASQTLPPGELIVSDDASTDQTRDIIRAFAESAPFPVVVIENSERSGPIGNFTKAISRCTGEWISLSDQDDIWLPDKLASLCAHCDDPQVNLVFSDVLLCDQSGTPTGATQWQRLGFGHAARQRFRQDPFDSLLRFNVVTGMSSMIRASTRPALLPIPDGWIHDEWSALILSAMGHVRFVDRPLAYYRQHPDQQIGGAVSGIWAQIRHARSSMNASYMNRMAERSLQAAERLESIGITLRKPDAPYLLKLRAEHYTHRMDPRLGRIWRDWRCGAYSRFGYGWKSVLQDFVLR